MAQVVIIPEAADDVTDVAMLIRLVQATGAAVIVSHCLHYRITEKEAGTVLVCDDCGAISPDAGAVPDLEPKITHLEREATDCPHGAEGQNCEIGCLCDCHKATGESTEQKIVDACSDHPKGCPPNSHLPGLCEHPNKEGSKDGTIVVCSDCGHDLSPPVTRSETETLTGPPTGQPSE